MATGVCQGCGNFVDTTATACPYCGRQNPTVTAQEEGMTAVMTIILIIFIVVLILIFS